MTQYTPNLKLALYESTDKPDLRNQYNESMNVIDANSITVGGEVAQIKTDLLNANTAIQKNATDIAANSASIGQLQSDYAAQQTTLDTVTQNITVLQGTTQQHTTDITTINGELAGLGVETIDDAVGLKTLIDDTNAQAMENQADIAVNSLLGEVNIKKSGNISGSSISELTMVVTNNKSFVKLFGCMFYPASTINLSPIPGTTDVWYKYGLPTGLIAPIRPTTARYISGTGITVYGGLDSGRFVDYLDWVIGADGQIYLLASSTNTISFEYVTAQIFIQTPISLNASGYNPPETNQHA